MRPCILLFVLLLFGVACNKTPPSEITINAADYGLAEGEDGTLSIINALEAVKAQSATKLILPQGTYHFTGEKALEKYMAVSNNDNGLKRMVFALIDFQDLEIDGQGSTLIFDGPLVPFCIEESRNIKINNLTIDWITPLYGQATVVAKSESDRSFDVKVEGEFEVHKGTLYTKTGKGIINTGRNLFFYPDKGGTVFRVDDYKVAPWSPWHTDSYRAEELENGDIRIHIIEIPEYRRPRYKLPEPGWVWVFKGSEKDKSRIAPAFRLYKSQNLVFNNITMHHSSGMGLIAEKCENVKIDRMRVEATPGTNRAVSTTADATHFVNCKGMIEVRNSYFAHMLDDAINVHGIYTKIVDVEGIRIGVQQIHHQQHGFDFAGPGDTLAIADNRTLETVGTYTVKSVKWVNATYQEITLDRPVESSVKLDYGVENISWSAGLIWSNNVVEKNRARGILFSTRGKVLIENSTFSNMMAGISVSGDNNYWFESGPSNSIIIRNNKFINCTTGGKGNYVIMVKPMILEPASATSFYNGSIHITGNTFEAFDKGIFYGLSIADLQFTNNTILHSNRFKPIYPDRSTFELNKTGSAVITGNTFNTFQDGLITIDRNSSTALTNENNQGQSGKIEIVEKVRGANEVL